MCAAKIWNFGIELVRNPYKLYRPNAKKQGRTQVRPYNVHFINNYFTTHPRAGTS